MVQARVHPPPLPHCSLTGFRHRQLQQHTETFIATPSAEFNGSLPQSHPLILCSLISLDWLFSSSSPLQLSELVMWYKSQNPDASSDWFESIRHYVCMLSECVVDVQVRAFLQPPMQGVVLETYGSGNAPDNRPDLLEELRKATDAGVIIINCTQCLRGTVSTSYATGKVSHLLPLLLCR